MTVGTQHKVWTIEISIDEQGEETCAVATLEHPDVNVGGWGRAKRNPVDPRVPRIGDEIATARALFDLAHRLMDAATVEVEQFSSREVHLHP